MTVKELKEIINTYPDDQFVHFRIWINNETNYDIVVNKAQQGVDGALLLTGDLLLVTKL